MALDKFRETSITWDKANKKVYESVRVSESDNKGRKLIVQVVNDGIVENMSGVSLSLYWETRNKKHEGLDAFTLKDAANGIYEIFYTTGMLSNPGNLVSHLVLVDATGKIVSEPFTITVFRGIDEGAIQSQDSFTALTTALAQVGNINGKVDKTELNELKSTTEQSLLSLNQQLAETGETLKGIDRTFADTTYPTLSALQAAYPNGDGKRYVVAADGKWYWWNGLAWVGGQVAQGIGIAKDGISADKINPSARTVNILDIGALVSGKFYFGSVGTVATQRSNSSFYGLPNPVPVKAGDVVRFNQAFQQTFYVGVDDTGTVLQLLSSRGTPSKVDVTVAAGVTGFYTTVFIDYLSTTMITINNPMPSEYTPYRFTKVMEWLGYKPKSISLSHLSDDVASKLDSGNGIEHEYVGTDGVIAGDSIVWNTGQVQNGETLIGYDGVLKRDLSLNSLQNIGVSGRPMANGTANGVGTHTTVTTAAIDWLTKDWWACNAGTNDNKLNVPIGTIQPFGSAFDTATYIGAYQATIEHLLTKNPNLKIIMFTPAQRKNGGYTTESTNTAGHKLIDYVNACKAIAQKYSALLVDVYSESGITEYTISQYTYDGLHLNNRGYEAAGGLVVKKLKYG